MWLYLGIFFSMHYGIGCSVGKNRLTLAEADKRFNQVQTLRQPKRCYAMHSGVVLGIRSPRLQHFSRA